MIKTLLSIFFFTAITANAAQNDRSFTIRLPQTDSTQAQTIRLTAVTDEIVRVEATPEQQIPKKKSSLMVQKQVLAGAKTWDVEEDWKDYILKTSRLRLTVNKQTGRIMFFDLKTGRKLLAELPDGGKTFKRFVSNQTHLPETYKPSSPEELNWGKTDSLYVISEADRSGYTWHAQFESNADEAFYGLGQHQSEEMNYKGRNEELFQYNTKVSVPFVMSNKGYGLLWDSYSYGRWGNPRDYQQLNRAFTLYDKDGKQGSLTGTYTDKKGKTLVRQEDSIYYEHSGVIGNLPKKFNLDGSKVLYEGYISAPQSATYNFILYYAGYVKVYIGGRLVVPERWRTAWNPNAYKFAVDLARGQKTPLRIEWQPDGGVSYCGLRAAVPQTAEQQNNISIWSEMSKDMDYYFIAGETMDSVIAGYRTLTGRAQVMPRWAMGFWQSRERYKTADELLAVMSEFRRRQIPVDNIVQDWSYWPEDAWGSHDFDKKRFPNPQQMIDSVAAMHGRLMISVWPKFYCTTDNYKAFDRNGWMYRQAVNDSIRDWIGQGYLGSFYDAYSAGARKLFWEQMCEKLYKAPLSSPGGDTLHSIVGSSESSFWRGWEGGANVSPSGDEGGASISAWWMDASEPNVRDCTPIGYRKLLCGPTAMGTSDEYFNAYSVVNADAIYNGQRSVNPNQRVFLLTRSGFAGLQRYSTATWSGDIGTRWEDMRAQMTAGINFSMSGIPFWGMDNGGFCVEKRYERAQKEYNKSGNENADLREWRELQARWHQFGCFAPLYRTHGQWPTREVWNIAPEGHPAYESIVYYHKLRYRLMPYLYSMAGWVNQHHYTIMRGLAMDFTGDSRVNNIGDQWMFGPSLMACPVGYYEHRDRNVYFPDKCGWYDLYSGTFVGGGQVKTVGAPYGRIPVFVPEGSIIPFGPALQWSDEKPAELIDLYVYAGRDGRFQLYEDENTNYNYEQGHFATIDITYDDARRTLTIAERKGSFKGMLSHRRFNIILVTKEKPLGIDCVNPKGKMVKYDGGCKVVRL